MPVLNHVPELLAWKCGGQKRIVAQDIADDARLSFAEVIRWSKEPRLENFEAPVLEAWCHYFGVSVGQILVYVPDEVAQGYDDESS